MTFSRNTFFQHGSRLFFSFRLSFPLGPRTKEQKEEEEEEEEDQEEERDQRVPKLPAIILMAFPWLIESWKVPRQCCRCR